MNQEFENRKENAGENLGENGQETPKNGLKTGEIGLENEKIANQKPFYEVEKLGYPENVVKIAREMILSGNEKNRIKTTPELLNSMIGLMSSYEFVFKKNGFKWDFRTPEPGVQLFTIKYKSMPDFDNLGVRRKTMGDIINDAIEGDGFIHLPSEKISSVRIYASNIHKGKYSVSLVDGKIHIGLKRESNSIAAQIRRASEGELIKISGNVQSYRQVASQSPASVTVFKHEDDHYCTNELIKPFWALKLHTEGMDVNTVKDFMIRVGL